MREEIDKRREMVEPDGSTEFDETRTVIETAESKRQGPQGIIAAALAFFFLAGLAADVAINNDVQSQAGQLQHDTVVIRAQSQTIRALQAQEKHDAANVGQLQSEVAQLEAQMKREQHDPNF